MTAIVGNKIDLKEDVKEDIISDGKLYAKV